MGIHGVGTGAVALAPRPECPGLRLRRHPVDRPPNGGGGRIWDRTTGLIIYDNQIGADEYGDANTVIGGGSIVIHKG